MYKKEAIPQLDFPKYHLLKDVYISANRIAFFESVDGLGLGYYPHRIHTATLVLCRQGSCLIETNQRKYEFCEGSIGVILPGQILQMKSISDDFKPLCIVVSREFIEDIKPRIGDLELFLQLTRDNGILRLNPEEYQQLVCSYELLKSKFKAHRSHACYRNLLENLVISIFFECYGFLQKHRGRTDQISKKECLFKAFIRLVVERYRTHRSSAYYAAQLGVPPKYLAAVVEEISAKSAKNWIDEYVILDAKVLLATTDKSIQEIAEELNFPDQSFFGKYFKRIVEMSPKDYRNCRDIISSRQIGSDTPNDQQ